MKIDLPKNAEILITICISPLNSFNLETDKLDICPDFDEELVDESNNDKENIQNVSNSSEGHISGGHPNEVPTDHQNQEQEAKGDSLETTPSINESVPPSEQLLTSVIESPVFESAQSVPEVLSMPVDETVAIPLEMLTPAPEVIQPIPENSTIPIPEVLSELLVPPVRVVDLPVIAPTCDRNLNSTLTLQEFTKQLIAATKDLLYPSESDFPIEVLSKGLNIKMPPIKGIEVRSLERVFPSFLWQVDPDDQQTGNAERATIADRWKALYNLIKQNSIATAWHYPVKQNRYTHEQVVIMLHPQGLVGLRIKLVET
jgi:Nuclease A inhibitor-like protein